MNSKLALALPQLIGKEIASIVVREGASPRSQLFLVFTDETYYEFYSDGWITGTRGLNVGDAGTVLDWPDAQEVTVVV